MYRSEEFIKKFRKRLVSGSDFYNPDTSLMPIEKFESSKCKILLIFPSPHSVKTVSSTAASINDYFIEHCPDCFIDFAYMPEGQDIKHYDVYNVPYAIGNITHLDPSHFDVVGFSISVLSEIVTAPVMLKSFSRCDKPIPLWWSDRKDLPLSECPIVYAGGITAVCGDVMFGSVGDKTAFLDFLYLGSVDKTDILVNRLIEAKETGKVTRYQKDHDIPGYEHKDIDNFESTLPIKSNQDYIESLFDLNMIYHPQAYEVKFGKYRQVISNKKINEKAADFVTPYYPHVLAEDLGIGRAIIQGNGDNCLIKSTRVLTEFGYQKIENLNNCKLFNGKSYVNYEKLIRTKGNVIELKLNQGVSIKATPEHKQYIWNGDAVTEVLVKDIRVGDWVLQYTNDFNAKVKVGSFPYFAGLWYGDGCRAGGSSKWEKDYYIEQCVAAHEIEIAKLVENTEYKEIKSNISSVRNFGLPKNSKLSKFIHDSFPDYKDSIETVLNWSLEDKVSFIRGWFDADGSSDKEGSISLAVSGKRKRVIEDLIIMLNSLGIRCHLMDNRVTKSFNKEFSKCEIKLVGENSYKRYFDMIGFTQPEKSVIKRTLGIGIKDNCIPASFGKQLKTLLYADGFKINSWKKKHNVNFSEFLNGKNGCPLNKVLSLTTEYNNNLLDLLKQGYSFTRVEDIRDLGVCEVYDIKNVEGHGFIAETYVTHNCGTTQTQVAEGCSSGGACSFCSEGNYCGGWVEKSRERVLWECREAKKYSAGYKYKPYSFNANYFTDYKGTLAEFIKIYPKVTFINMRMEELGRDVDAIKMMKLIGSNRISAPIEGLSPRIQNNLLNKCLSEESLNNFMDDMVHMKMTDIKVGGIFTGYEEDEDFQWICDFVDKFKTRAEREGGNFPFRLKCCATRDAVTPINGMGLVRQDFISKGQSIIGYEDAEVIETKPMGLSDIYQITTNFGNSIRVTPNHPVLTKWTAKSVKEEHYTQAKDLKEGDNIYLRMGTECYGSPKMWKLNSIPLDSNLAAVFGWYMGDGYANVHDNFKTFGCCFNESEGEIRSYIEHTLKGIGLSPREHNQPGKKITAFRVHNAEFTRELVKEFGHTAYGKKVSDLILQSPKDVQATFLGYWFAADGTVVNYPHLNYNSRIKLYSVNREALQDAQTMLFNMGIISILSGHKTKCGGKDFYTYQLEIKSTSVSKFSKTILIPGVKASKIVVANTRGSHCLKSNGVVKCHVKKVEQLPEEETFGLEVSNHSYLTNAILSHNTPLVHYPLTPCEYLERKSAKKSFLGEHWLTDEWYAKFKEHQVFFKVNGFRYSTFLEQSFVDLGRALTPLIYKHFILNLSPIYSLRSVATDEFVYDLKKFVNPYHGKENLTEEQIADQKDYLDHYFGDRDPEHYISPAHRIHIELMGSYIPRARRLVRAKKSGNIFSNPMDIRCLKTYTGAKVKCYNNCIVKDPLKIYNDVELDENNNLVGESRDLIGCERCQSKEQRLWRLSRDTPQTKNSDDIAALPRIPQVQKLRFVLKRVEEYDVLNPNNTAHTFMTKFLQLSDNLLDSFHSIVNHNLFWQADPQAQYVVSGTQIVDTLWSKNVYSEVKKLIPEVNKLLKSVQIISVTEELKEEKIKVDDLNVFYFESSIAAAAWESARHSYDGSIRIFGGMGVAEVIKDSSLMQPVFVTKGKVKGCFAIPAKYNPVEYLTGFLSSSKKTTSNSLVEDTDISCIMVMRETKAVCKRCGKEKALISITTGASMPFGKECLCKAILTKLS